MAQPLSQKKMGCAIGRWYCPYFRIDRSVSRPRHMAFHAASPESRSVKETYFPKRYEGIADSIVKFVLLPLSLAQLQPFEMHVDQVTNVSVKGNTNVRICDEICGARTTSTEDRNTHCRGAYRWLCPHCDSHGSARRSRRRGPFRARPRQGQELAGIARRNCVLRLQGIRGLG